MLAVGDQGIRFMGIGSDQIPAHVSSTPTDNGGASYGFCHFALCSWQCTGYRFFSLETFKPSRYNR